MNKSYVVFFGMLLSCSVLTPFAAQAASDAPSFCRVFEKDLRYGAAGNTSAKADIVGLQDFLYARRLLSVPSTGHFGPLTLSAVKKFQAAYNIPATGFVGPVTRAKINSFGGCGEGQDRFPVIYSLIGPTALKTGEQGSWVVTASDRMAGALSYGVDWGESNPLNSVSGASIAGISFLQTGAFSHAYDAAGTYRVTFTVKNGQTKSISQKTITVLVTDSGQSSVTATTPNGTAKTE